MESQDEKLRKTYDGVYDCLVELINNPLVCVEKCKGYETYCMTIATHIMTKSNEKDYCGYKKLEEAKNNGNKIGLNCVKKGISTKLILKTKEEVDKEPLNKMLFKYQCLLWDYNKLAGMYNALNNEIIGLEGQVKEADNNREVQISENRNLRKKNTELKGNNKKLSDENVVLKNDKSKLEELMNTLMENNDKLHEENEILKTDFEKMREKTEEFLIRIKNLEEQVKALGEVRSKLEKAGRKNVELKSVNKKLVDENTRLKNYKSKMPRNYFNYINYILNELKISSEKIRKLEKDNSALLQDKKELLGKVNDLEKQVNDSSKTKNELKNRIKVLESMNAQLKSKNDNLMYDLNVAIYNGLKPLSKLEHTNKSIYNWLTQGRLDQNNNDNKINFVDEQSGKFGFCHYEIYNK